MVCLSNSSIVSIPELSFEPSEYSTFKHSTLIRKLLCTSESRVFGCCDQNGIYRFEITNGAVTGYVCNLFSDAH